MNGTLFQLKFIFQDHHTEEAYNYYRLALSKSLTRGRRAEQIYASCVYLSCRTGSTDTEHMLLGMVLIKKTSKIEFLKGHENKNHKRLFRSVKNKCVCSRENIYPTNPCS